MLRVCDSHYEWLLRMIEVHIWPTGPTRRFPLPPVPWPLPPHCHPASDSWCRPCSVIDIDTADRQRASPAEPSAPASQEQIGCSNVCRWMEPVICYSKSVTGHWMEQGRRQERKLARQLTVPHGAVRVQPGRTGRRKNSWLSRREETRRRSSLPDAPRVSFLCSLTLLVELILLRRLNGEHFIDISSMWKDRID